LFIIVLPLSGQTHRHWPIQNDEVAKTIEVSARNALKGSVKALAVGAVNAEETVEVAPGIEVVAITPNPQLKDWGLQRAKWCMLS
jgi:molybdopterin-binding protein